MKYLLNWWRAKEIEEVIEENKKIDLPNLDKLDFNWIPYPKVVQILDKMIKNGYLDEYDYLIFTSPDLVVKQENVEQLMKDCEDMNADAMCGVCNVDLDKNKDKYPVCMELFKARKYVWVNKGELSGIHKVFFNGRVLMALSKRIFKTFPWFEKTHSEPYDLQICRWLAKHNIPLYTNFDNEMLHLRSKGELLAGKVPMEVWWKGKQIEIVS